MTTINLCLETFNVTLKLLNMVFRQPFFPYSYPQHTCVSVCTHGHTHMRTYARTPMRARALIVFPSQERTPSHPAACFFCFLVFSAFLFFTLALLVEVSFYLEAEISPAPPTPSSRQNNFRPYISGSSHSLLLWI